MMKDEIEKCFNREIIEELIHETTLNFDLVASHQLLRISSALTLCEMEQNFLEMELKNNDEIKVFLFC